MKQQQTIMFWYFGKPAKMFFYSSLAGLLNWPLWVVICCQGCLF